jgi:cytochrome c
MAVADDADGDAGGRAAAGAMIRDCRVRAAAAAGLTVAALAASATGWVQAAQEPAATRSVSDGVYTTAQAMRGRDQYRKRCVLCHLDNGQGHAAMPVIPGESLEREGDAEAPAVAGDAFQKKWSGRTAWALFDTMSSTMPVGGARTLSPQEYADLLAYLLELNKFPAGARELTPARDDLERIAFGR